MPVVKSTTNLVKAVLMQLIDHEGDLLGVQNIDLIIIDLRRRFGARYVTYQHQAFDCPLKRAMEYAVSIAHSAGRQRPPITAPGLLPLAVTGGIHTIFKPDPPVMLATPLNAAPAHIKPP